MIKPVHEIKIPAQGITGHLLYSHHDGGFFFRVYDSVDKSIFKDYRLAAEDIEVEIIDKFIVLVQNEDNPEVNRLDFSDKALGKK